MSSFTSIPILDLSLARDPATKPAFLADLRHALLNVGFLYLKNIGVSKELTEDVIREGKAFFDIPLEEKLAIRMSHAPSFLGYSPLSAEITAHAIDHREQLDLSTPHPPILPHHPLYYNLFGPCQWPSPSLLPNFRPVYESYIKQMADVSMFFTRCVAESIGLAPDAFDRFFENDDPDMGGTLHKLKVVKYPDLKSLEEAGMRVDGGEGQGVGPHKDSMLSSYLLQASQHRGLQVQNQEGEWIDVPPVEGTWVVAIGQGMEAITRGVCKSTTHRVLSPEKGKGARYSVPFFQGVGLDRGFEGVDVLEEVLALRRERGGDGVEFTFTGDKYKSLGEATLMNRIKSHPDVGERWYPELLKIIREDQAKEAEQKPKPSSSEDTHASSRREVSETAQKIGVQAQFVEAH